MVELKSIIKCPECGFEKEKTMPTDACQFFYECSQCHARLKPKEGDCCVYCSYGTVPCPSMQTEFDYNEYDQLLNKLKNLQQRAEKKVVIGLDGTVSSGKTTLSNKIASDLQINLINLDDFIAIKSGHYVKALNFELLKQKADVLIGQPNSLIIEGCCVLQIAQKLDIKFDILLYCKEISADTRLWHFGHYFDHDLPASKQGLSLLDEEIIKYHDHFRPWEKADITYNLINQQKA